MSLFKALTGGNHNLSRLIADLCSEYGLGQDAVMYCLELALQQLMCEYFNVRECDVDLDAGTVTPVFVESSAFNPLSFYNLGYLSKIDTARLWFSSSNYTVPGDLLPVEFSLERLAGVIRSNYKHFEYRFSSLLTEARNVILGKKWLKKVHQAVEGVITECAPDHIAVAMEDETVWGIMSKRQWTPLEKASYREDKLLMFYVLKLEYFARPLIVVDLSRGSIGLPGAILKTLAPWVKVNPIKRIRGKKTWLRVSPPVPKNLLKEVSVRLNGEVIEVVSN